MDKVVALAKRRGFIYPSSEIYGGIAGFWDYGPLGTELKRNIKQEWWKQMVQLRDDVVGLDAAIIMNPQVWKASGHVDAFTDPLIECKICHRRFREDKPEEVQEHEAEHKGKKVEWTEPMAFNLLVGAELGVVEGKKQGVYLRGEITQGVFVNFKNVVDSTRVKIPFGIAQIGKAFRNEITPGNLIYRSREFEQMELEFFIKPEKSEGDKWFSYWKDQRMKWYLSLGMKKENLRFRDHEEDEKAHYAQSATDIEYNAPFGWSEFEGIHHRGDWDLSRHKLTHKEEGGDEFTPWVIETSGGVDRSALFFLLNAYHEEDKRVVLRLHPRLAPYKVAVFPLVANKKELVDVAREIYDNVRGVHMSAWDDRGNIGKRYAAQDEIGTPFCVTVDYQTIEDGTVTVRHRDTAKQERIAKEGLASWISEQML